MSQYNKTIWNSGDIITTEKMNNIINNTTLSIPRMAYQLPIVEDSDHTGEYIINKSFSEIHNLIIQGIFCYMLVDLSDQNDNNDYYTIYFITSFNSNAQTISTKINNIDYTFYSNGNIMRTYYAIVS